MAWVFPGGLVVGTSLSSAKIPQASEPKNQNIKQKQHHNQFNKDFQNKMFHTKKILKRKKCLKLRDLAENE